MNLALEIRQAKFGENHTDAGAAYAGLALILLNQEKFDKADKMDAKSRKVLSATQGQYRPNKNQISKLRPGPAEILKAKSKSLRLP